MAIDGWNFVPVDLELAVPYRWARGTQTRRNVILVRCQDGGQDGWGEIAPPPDDQRTAAHWMRLAREATRGRLDIDALEDDIHPRVRCGLQEAASDLRSRQAGTSLAKHWWKEPSSTVPVNALVTAASPDVVRQLCAAAALVGYPAIKLKIGTDPEADLARARAAREGAPRTALRLDANAAWSPEQARELLPKFLDLEIDYIEQPVAPEHETALQELGRIGIPIALDESATSAQEIERLLDEDVGDVVIVKAQRVGGTDRGRDCIQTALRLGRRAVVTNSLETSIGVHHALHLAAGTTEPAGLATGVFLATDVAPSPNVGRGMMAVPDGPGLGIRPEVS